MDNYKNCRITLNDNGITMIKKLAEGNPGAVSVMAEMFASNERIDPDDAPGGFGPILSLDTYGIYGSRIWMFYKDVCGQNLTAMLAVMRAVQLGYFNDSNLDAAIDKGTPLDIPALHAMVKKRLPRFADLEPAKPTSTPEGDAA